MSWNERPRLPLKTSIYWQCKGFCGSSEFYIVATFLVMVVAYSAFILTGVQLEEKYSPRSRPLVLHIDSFTINDFKVMETRLAANWTAKFIFINKKGDVEITIEPFDVLLFYKGSNLVSCASAPEPFFLEPNHRRVMEIELGAKGCNEELPDVDYEVLQEIKDERNKGRIRLNLIMTLEARYKASIWGYRLELEPSCDLDLEFNATAGIFKSKGATACRVPLPV